ncbi:hypothetical protein CLU79DRAFT_745617 [Phycomyces nitens]|nr:hypothetical protein CLU79DRAFT_745617 [Phycomyces nitens]
MKLSLVLFALFAVGHGLPISLDNSAETTMENIEPPNEPFVVQIDQFTQLVSTHLHFDHLEPIISTTYREISGQLQHHIEITVHDTSLDTQYSRQHSFQQSQSLEGMDIEILQAQISGAIQAHTEGNLPLAWDRVADKLSRPALEAYLSQLISTQCGITAGFPVQADQADSGCLMEKAVSLSTNIDHYIASNLSETFLTLDQTVLPDLLEHTARDLKQVLDYFNAVFLRHDERQLSLRVIPWNEHTNHANAPTDIEAQTFSSKLLQLASRSLSSDDHPIEFFFNYASLARV